MTGKTGMRQSKGLILGITGGVGAGKSTILSYLSEKYGAQILEADKIGHLLQQPGTSCWNQIMDTFGAGIQNEDQTINRERLGAIVYADREKLETLNAIIHPAVKAYIRGEIEKFHSQESKTTLLVIEAALLLENHYEELCDEIWYIFADEQTRRKRLMNSRGYSDKKVRQIMENQMSEAEFRRRCPVVIDNSGEDLSLTCRQIDQALDRYRTVL